MIGCTLEVSRFSLNLCGSSRRYCIFIWFAICTKNTRCTLTLVMVQREYTLASHQNGTMIKFGLAAVTTVNTSAEVETWLLQGLESPDLAPYHVLPFSSLRMIFLVLVFPYCWTSMALYINEIYLVQERFEVLHQLTAGCWKFWYSEDLKARDAAGVASPPIQNLLTMHPDGLTQHESCYKATPYP